MTVGKNRVRLAVEQLEDRRTPSAVMHGLEAPAPELHGGPQTETVAHVRAEHGDANSVNVVFRCFVDLSAGTVSSTGFTTGRLGRWEWTALGHTDNVDIDLAVDRGVYSGTGTLIAANGDQLYYSFTTSWRLSKGKGTHSITVTGGTGAFAGASGEIFSHCTITAGQTPQTYTCRSEGFGIVILQNP